MAEPNSRRNRAEVRCHCGSLMARVTDHGIELKCRRCKRVVLVATDQGRREWVTVPLHWEDRPPR
jgi:phage FluMu protein Com